MSDDDFRFPSKPGDKTGRPVDDKTLGGSTVGTKSPATIQDRALQLANELRAHARIEASQGQLSPTDNALMLRIEAFLRNDVGGSKS